MIPAATTIDASTCSVQSLVSLNASTNPDASTEKTGIDKEDKWVSLPSESSETS